MNKDSVVDRTRLLLGGNVLKLEVSDDDIKKLIDVAYDKIKPFITDTVLITKPFASVILLEEHIEDVLQVYPSDSTIITQDKMFDFEGIKLDGLSVKKAILGSYPIIDNDIRFKFYDHKLYLESDKTYTGMITIEGLVTPDIESLKDEKAETWIFSYTLALAKTVCGRVRSKFKSSNIPIELDGDTILSEGLGEMQTLEAELQDRQFGPFKILR